MRVFVGLCLTSAAFGLVVGIAYFFVAHEETVGTAMLAAMTVALTFCGGYALVAERHADLEGDEKDAAPEDAAGTDLGIFTKQSAWPVLAALCAVVALIGLLWIPLAGGIAVAALVLVLWRMGAESARAS